MVAGSPMKSGASRLSNARILIPRIRFRGAPLTG
jgi:hypothetical protein